MSTVSLVLETNNLHGAAKSPDGRPPERASRITESLEELLVHLRAQTSPLASLAELVVTHEGLTDDDQARLARAAGRDIAFVAVAKGTGYYEAKNRGFEATTGDVVVFGDADCWPENDWLRELTEPFDDQDVEAVAGRTCYRGDLLGTAATTIDFMYFPSPLGEGCTRNFYANNVAFRRTTFERARYVLGGTFYRGNCQVLGLKLQEDGVKVTFQPRARTTHRFPDGAKDFVRLRLLRGADAVALAPHLGRAYLPKALAPLAAAPGLEAVILGSRLFFSLGSINAQDMPEVHGAKRLACAALVAGISALDAAGACLKRVGLAHLVSREDADVVALGYHENVDALS
jgi:hypothetical protein